MLNIIEKPQPAEDYYREVTKKTALVLHFTAGTTAESAKDTLDKADHVAVSYIVDLNGDVWHRFDRKYWAWHLGGDCGRAQNKRTIGIEIVNIGPVWLREGRYYDYTGRVWPAEKVAAVPYRGTAGAVKFPEAQTAAVCELVDVVLQREPNIPRKIPRDRLAYRAPDFGGFNGVATHMMCRKDKYDLGPAFEYKRLVEVCGLQEI